MLNPRDRHLLLESLRPPAGYVLSRAIGTSYSLDLLALLTAPLAFTFFDWEDNEGEISADPLALLESVRRHADKILLFCHAGGVKVPPPNQRLLAYLERCVVEVLPSKDASIFHPKVWILRFESEDEPVRYRFLCLSRNLTFDRSWDSILSFDGVLEDRQLGFAKNRPLGEFVDALPKLAVREFPQRWRKHLSQIADEIRKTRFELPDGVEDYQFLPLGLTSHNTWPFPDGQYPVLIMSPFVAPGCLQKLSHRRHEATLISRAEELAKLSPDALEGFDSVYAMDGSAEFDAEDVDAAAPGISGLHAKLFIIDDGRKAHVFTGSANATNAAFNGNVEFLTEIVGKKKDFGISAFLADESKPGESFLNLLQPWTKTSVERSATELLQEHLERELRIGINRFARTRPRVNVESSVGNYTLTLIKEDDESAPMEIALTCWPSTLRKDDAVPVTNKDGVLAKFGPLSLDAVTGFIAFEAKLEQRDCVVAQSFVLNLPVDNAPDDRFDRILAALVKDKDRLIRLVWLLLQKEGEVSASAISSLVNSQGPSQATRMEETYPIFESLIKSLSGGSRRIDEIGRLLKDLRKSPEGEELIPEGLYELWQTLKLCLDETDGPA